MDKDLLNQLSKIERKALSLSKRENSEARVARSGDSLRLYGVVGDPWDGITDDLVAEALDGLDSDAIDVRVNSPGGMVFMGMAIYQLMKERNVTFTVDGLAASIMSVIIMAGRVRVHRGSQIMIHNPLVLTIGDQREHEKSAEMLGKIKQSIIAIYQAKTGLEEDLLTEMMDDETWLTAEEAIEWGFADELIDDDSVDPSENVANLDLSILRAKYPEQVAAMSRTAPTNEEVTKMTTDVKPQASGAETPDNKANDEALAKARQEAKAAEKERQRAIRHAVGTAGLPSSFADELIDADVTIDKAREEIINEWGKPDVKTEPAGNIAITRDERDTLRSGAVNALLHQHKPSLHKIEGDDPAREFVNMKLSRLAELCAERAGFKVRGASPNKIVQNAMHSTSDFPAILENVIGKSLRADYELAPRTFTAVGRQATLNDYKQVSRTQLSEAPVLSRVLEGGEYTDGSMSDAAEKYQLFKYGRIVSVTREVIINDDLDAITRVPAAMGARAAQLENELFWAQITGNPVMQDGTTLFHADHSNLAASGGAISVTTLGAGRTAMMTQTGLNGARINVMPSFLVVPAAILTAAEQFVSTNFQADESGKVNPFAGRLQVIAEPLLDVNDANAWYLFASPSLIDTVEYAYLAGEIGPQIETEEGFRVDGLQVKVRHDFGAKAIDWRGMYKNDGGA